MSYSVKPGSLSGRIGSGIGRGLADQVPKEIERNRLSNGLQRFSHESGDLTPVQQLAQLSSIPGITPQMIQSFGELAKQQNTRNAYQNRTGRGQQERIPTSADALKDVRFMNRQENIPQRNERPNNRPSDFSNEEAMANAEQGINDRSLARPEAVPRSPWSPERRNEEIARLSEEFGNLTIPEIQAMAADNEARELAQPAAEQERDRFYKEIKQSADEEFKKQLEIKLQKTDEATFTDLPGEMQLQLRKGMYKDIINGMSNEKAADKWTQIGLNQAKAKGELNKLANQGILDSLKKETTLNKLKSLQQIYSKAGNKESFYNSLISEFGLSPQGAALVAYPRSPKLKEYIKSTKTQPSPKAARPEKFAEHARKRVSDIEKLITPEDSLLAIVREFKDRDPYFDEHSFFNQLREDAEDLGLTPRQQKELAEGESSLRRAWGDVWLFPLSGRSVVND